ncbi:MAG: SMP-30/gluconolactonase/LRE family protein, partial [Verrucomicrobia bacterium]|nr:SMP-30/gluconolactonase/LRE family protein [Verrucomicrobiota bacterium]
ALWFCEYDGQRIRRLDAQGTLHTVAGTGAAGYSGDGGPATGATLHQPHELRFDAGGHLFIADMRNHAIRRVDAQTHRITTVAGTGEAGYSGDGGPAIAARLRQPHSIQFGPRGHLYIGDIGNHVIRRLDPQTGILTTIAGTGAPGPTPDNAPIAGTPLNGPRALDFDAAGRLWLATREGNQVFRLDLDVGVIRHMAGTGAKGFTGNGGPALQATLSGPKGLAVGPEGDVYLADTESHSIRRLDVRRGTLEWVIGTGEKGDGPDGDPATCRLARPHGVWLDPDGTLWIGDSENHRIRRLPAAAASGRR